MGIGALRRYHTKPATSTSVQSPELEANATPDETVETSGEPTTSTSDKASEAAPEEEPTRISTTSKKTKTKE